MNYGVGHCDNCQELTILKNTHGYGTDTSQCAECRHSDPQEDRDGYDAERETDDSR